MKIIPPGKQLSSIPKIKFESVSNQLKDQQTFFPRSISFEDIDRAVFDWFNTREIIIKNEKISVLFLTPEKWAEVKKSWNVQDSNHNIKFPYITVRRSQAPKLAASPPRGRIPGKMFNTYKVPFYTPSGPTYKIYQVPQPIKVDLEYEVRALTHYIEDINIINETLLKHFASLQAYLDIDKHYMPMTISSISDESNLDTIEDVRVIHTLYSIEVKGYIIDEKEFKEKLGIANILVNIEEETS